MTSSINDPSPAVDRDDRVLASVRAYDDHVAEYTAHNADAVLDDVARFTASLSPASRILDAGCGPGRDLARFTALGHRPVGLDLNAKFLAEAGRHAPVQAGDLRNMPFGDDQFDATWACASLVHLDPADAADALKEIARVTRPGGPVHVSVKCGGPSGWTDTAHGRRYFHVWTADEFADAARRAGLIVHDVVTGPVFVNVWASA